MFLLHSARAGGVTSGSNGWILRAKLLALVEKLTAMFIAALGCSGSCVGVLVAQRGGITPFSFCVGAPYKSTFVFGHCTEFYP